MFIYLSYVPYIKISHMYPLTHPHFPGLQGLYIYILRSCYGYTERARTQRKLGKAVTWYVCGSESSPKMGEKRTILFQ